jgi:hypothetical protein
MRIPYGISNFADLRRGGYVYADKTGFIPRLEDATKGRRYLVLLRPRRMGKTLLISMLEHYYDVLAAPDFDALFGSLAIAAAPTEERGRYAVLRLDMSGLTTDEGIDRLRADCYARLHHDLERFLGRYRSLLPTAAAAFDASVSTDAPASLLSRFLQAMQQSPHPLYVLVDEYDDFANDLIVRGDHDGDVEPFLRLVFTKVIRRLSNRDLMRLDEKTMKVILLAYLSLSEEVFAWSEVELGFGYGDLVLLPSRIQPVSAFAFVIELKYLKAGATDEAVVAKLDEGDAQLRRYLADDKLRALAGGKPWRALSVAFVGTEACWIRALGGEAARIEA